MKSPKYLHLSEVYIGDSIAFLNKFDEQCEAVIDEWSPGGILTTHWRSDTSRYVPGSRGHFTTLKDIRRLRSARTLEFKLDAWRLFFQHFGSGSSPAKKPYLGREALFKGKRIRGFRAQWPENGSMRYQDFSLHEHGSVEKALELATQCRRQHIPL